MVDVTYIFVFLFFPLLIIVVYLKHGGLEMNPKHGGHREEEKISKRDVLLALLKCES